MDDRVKLFKNGRGDGEFIVPFEEEGTLGMPPLFSTFNLASCKTLVEKLDEQVSSDGRRFFRRGESLGETSLSREGCGASLVILNSISIVH